MGEIWLKRGVLETDRAALLRIENKLKAIKLTARTIEKERVTVVDLGMVERGGDGLTMRSLPFQ